MRAEIVFVHRPAFVRCGGKASGEQVLFVLAEAGNAPDFLVNAREFFFHGLTLRVARLFVEAEFKEVRPLASRRPARQFALGF